MDVDSTELSTASKSAKLRLTAVITNYNYGRFLPAAVEAMVNQSRPADELILIDDASTDGSQNVVDQIALQYPFIKVVRHQVNRGANLSGQEALDMAIGDFFYWGSADDLVLPGFFESAMSLFDRFPNSALCAGVPIHWEEDSNRQFETCLELPRESQFISPRSLWPLARNGKLDMGGAWTIYRVSDLAAMGGFRVSLKWLADWLPVYGLALGRGLAWTGQPSAVMRFHSGNYSRIGPERRDEQKRVLADLAKIIAEETPAEIQAGFRESGILGQLAWPMAWALMANQRCWSQLTPSFWRVVLELMAYRAAKPIIRAVLPKALRRTMAKTTQTPASFDLSVMKSRKSP